MDLIFIDNYEENDIWHDKFKKYFFWAICDLHRPCTITSQKSKNKDSCDNWHYTEQY